MTNEDYVVILHLKRKLPPKKKYMIGGKMQYLRCKVCRKRHKFRHDGQYEPMCQIPGSYYGYDGKLRIV